MDILKIWEGELRRMLLYDKGSYDVANSRYNDLMEQCDITEQEYWYADIALRVGERFNLLGKTAVEKAAARQWVQYRITRLGSGTLDKRELDEVLQELDDYLKDRTYLAGAQFGISDLFFYCCTVLYQYLVEVTTQRLPYRHSNLVRWFDQVSSCMKSNPWQIGHRIQYVQWENQ